MMKRPKSFQVAWVAVAALSCILAPFAFTRSPDSVRVVRLSRSDGEVFILHSGARDWEEASANLPLQEGDSVATQAGFAEIEFDNGAMAYLAENSVLQFTQLGFAGGGRDTELTLTQGAATFEAGFASDDTFVVHTLTFDVAAQERAEFRIDGFRDGAAAEVLSGTIRVSTTRGTTDLTKGQSVAVHLNDSGNFTIGSLPEAEDAFDRLVAQEGERIRSGNKNTLSYVNSRNYYGLSDLSIYGHWVNLPGYGFGWRPFAAGMGWTPYFNGRWILDPRLGWIWVSNEPWGWTPYHYGSWLLSVPFGWVWVPGAPNGLRQWEPARVDWVRVGTQVGWVAKSPEDREGIPANLQKGVIVTAGRTPSIASESHRIFTGRELTGATPISQPPIELGSRPEPERSTGTWPGMRPNSNSVPPTPKVGSSIVYDRGTRTYIQGEPEGAAGHEGIRTGPAANTNPAGSAALMPGSNGPNGSSVETPRVAILPSGPVNSRVDRTFPPVLNSSRERFPVVPANPAVPEAPGNSQQLRSAPANNFRPHQFPGSSPNTQIGSTPAVPLRPSIPATVPSPAAAPAPARGSVGNVVSSPTPASRPVPQEPQRQVPPATAPRGTGAPQPQPARQ
jgi:hypothetical protein